MIFCQILVYRMAINSSMFFLRFWRLEMKSCYDFDKTTLSRCWLIFSSWYNYFSLLQFTIWKQKYVQFLGNSIWRYYTVECGRTKSVFSMPKEKYFWTRDFYRFIYKPNFGLQSLLKFLCKYFCRYYCFLNFPSCYLMESIILTSLKISWAWVIFLPI